MYTIHTWLYMILLRKVYIYIVRMEMYSMCERASMSLNAHM